MPHASLGARLRPIRTISRVSWGLSGKDIGRTWRRGESEGKLTFNSLQLLWGDNAQPMQQPSQYQVRHGSYHNPSLGFFFLLLAGRFWNGYLFAGLDERMLERVFIFCIPASGALGLLLCHLNHLPILQFPRHVPLHPPHQTKPPVQLCARCEPAYNPRAPPAYRRDRGSPSPRRGSSAA